MQYYALVVLVAVLGNAATAGGTELTLRPLPYWASAKAFANFTREDAADCALACSDGLIKTRDSRGHWVFVHGEKDGCIDIHEIDLTKEALLTQGQRLMSVFVKPNEKIMLDCNNNSKEEKEKGLKQCIDRTDMLRSTKGCVAGPYRLNMFRSYICHNCRDKFWKEEAKAAGVFEQREQVDNPSWKMGSVKDALQQIATEDKAEGREPEKP